MPLGRDIGYLPGDKDEKLAALLQLDPHTVARGRQQLLDQDVAFARVRKLGGGRQRAP